MSITEKYTEKKRDAHNKKSFTIAILNNYF